jgi:hypothetical protein
MTATPSLTVGNKKRTLGRQDIREGLLKCVQGEGRAKEPASDPLLSTKDVQGIYGQKEFGLQHLRDLASNT